MAVEIAESLEHLQRRRDADAARAAERAAALTRLLPTARDILSAHGATRVFVFGSVATGRVTADSDLDLATEGLPSATYFDALGDLLRALPCAVDLVRLEEAPNTLRDRVFSEGILL